MIIRAQMGDAMGWSIGGVLKTAGSKLGGVAVKAGEVYADVQTGGQYSAIKNKILGKSGGGPQQPTPEPAKKIPGWVVPAAIAGGVGVLFLALRRK